MPIYEYRCRACAHRFEALMQRSDEGAPECPQCGASKPEKLLSAFTVTQGGSSAPPMGCGSAGCSCRRH